MPETKTPQTPPAPPAPATPQTEPSSPGNSTGKPKPDEEPPRLEDDKRIERFRER
jgi:hypothetical protein